MTDVAWNGEFPESGNSPVRETTDCNKSVTPLPQRLPHGLWCGQSHNVEAIPVTVKMHRVDPFREVARQAIESQAGPAALDQIQQAHDGTVSGLQSRLEAAEQEVDHALTNAKMRADMLSLVHATAAHEILRAAKLHAHLKTTRSIIDLVQKLVAQAAADGTGAVAVESLERALEQPLPPVAFGPMIVSYVPDNRYRKGRFSCDEGDMIQVHPFVGWSHIVSEPAPDRDWEPTFLVGERLLPVSSIRLQYGMKLDCIE